MLYSLKHFKKFDVNGTIFKKLDQSSNLLRLYDEKASFRCIMFSYSVLHKLLFYVFFLKIEKML